MTHNATGDSKDQNAEDSDGYVEPAGLPYRYMDPNNQGRAANVSQVEPPHARSHGSNDADYEYAEPYEYPPPRQSEPVYQEIED